MKLPVMLQVYSVGGKAQQDFAGTMKKAYVSRMYIKALMIKLEEKRIKK